MAKTDIISSSLNTLNMYASQAKKVCFISPSSKLLISVFKKIKDLGYIKEFEVIDDGKGKVVKIELTGKINECRAIRPRNSVKFAELEKFEKRFLPARNFGFLIISTPQGIITHVEAKQKKVGGKLIAYVF
ncbi:MAG: 30S ribosomal protein S8 [Nanoarchaeota archaeon]|nr:30S ribosomal protein S8 [Nanoarchaeota archaeon]